MQAAGADVHAAEPGGLCTHLLLAASKGHADVVRVLLDSGARVADLDCNDQTPLHRAAGAGMGAVVKLLLAETGVKVNESMYFEDGGTLMVEHNESVEDEGSGL